MSNEINRDPGGWRLASDLRCFEEVSFEFVDDRVGHGRERGEGAGVDEGLGGGFEDFEVVEGFENGGAGDEDAVVVGAARWDWRGGGKTGVASLSWRCRDRREANG